MKKIVTIGLGRVGLPFSLYLETLGFQVSGIDRDEQMLSKVRDRVMPFEETGCDELLKNSKISVSNDFSKISEADYIIITVGTPLHAHIETDLSAIKAVVGQIIKHVRNGQTIILRSTLAPETTKLVKSLIELKSSFKVGRDIGLAFCPERLAENQALKELKILPQIVGSEDDMSKKACDELFKKFNVKIFHTNYTAAELVKLFNNSSRYLNFAIANHFSIVAEDYGQNIYELLQMANEDYIRGHIYSPGLTAGTCLRKDFGFINERSSSPDILLAAWKVNEYMPYHMVSSLASKMEIFNKKIAVLGYTFKKNTDDVRDSLVPKLIRYIERKAPGSIVMCEPNLEDKEIEGVPNVDLKTALKDADAVFLAVNHDEFSNPEILKLAKPEAWFVDIWNSLKTNKFVFNNL